MVNNEKLTADFVDLVVEKKVDMAPHIDKMDQELPPSLFFPLKVFLRLLAVTPSFSSFTTVTISQNPAYSPDNSLLVLGCLPSTLCKTKPLPARNQIDSSHKAV